MRLASTRRCRASQAHRRRAGPILSKRALESTVLVDDQQIVVLGGLIQDTLTDGTEKVPLLRRHPGVRIAVPLRHALAREDQPDDLPASRRSCAARPTAASSRRSATTTCAASKIEASRTEPSAGSGRTRTRAACCRRMGTMPRAHRRRPRVGAARTAAAAERRADARASRTRSRGARRARAGAPKATPIVVLLRPDATVEGIAELKRVLQPAAVTRAVDAERSPPSSPRAYNQARRGARDERGSRATKPISRA